MNAIKENTNFDIIGPSSSSSASKSYESCAQNLDLSNSKLGDDSQFYFNNIIKNDKYGGIQALTAQAFAGCRTDELANKEEALYYLQVANFVRRYHFINIKHLQLYFPKQEIKINLKLHDLLCQFLISINSIQE